MSEEFTEKLDKYKTQGMTEEQFTTAKDIRRRGKNKVGCDFFFNFNVYLPKHINVTAQNNSAPAAVGKSGDGSK